LSVFIKGISKNAPFPLQWRGIKGEAKQIIRVLGMPLSKYRLKQNMDFCLLLFVFHYFHVGFFE